MAVMAKLTIEVDDKVDQVTDLCEPRRAIVNCKLGANGFDHDKVDRRKRAD